MYIVDVSAFNVATERFALVITASVSVFAFPLLDVVLGMLGIAPNRGTVNTVLNSVLPYTVFT